MYRRKLHMIPLSVIMFLTGSGMFASRGNYSHLIIKICELCFTLWLPILIMGTILCIAGDFLKFINLKKLKYKFTDYITTSPYILIFDYK
jgi:hypothetical protein